MSVKHSIYRNIQVLSALCTVVFSWSINAKAQETAKDRWPVPDTFQQFYSVNYNLTIDKFEREHESLYGKSAKMIPFRSGRRFGFVKPGKPNKWLISPRFAQVYGVYKDLAIVKDTSYDYGLINKQGDYLTYPIYNNLMREGNLFRGTYYVSGDTAYDLPDGYNAYMRNDFFNEKGEFLFSENVHDMQSFTNGDSLAWFRFGRTYSIRSSKGNLIKQVKNTKHRSFVAINDNKLIFKELKDEQLYYTAETSEGKKVFSLPISFSYLQGIVQLSDNVFGLLAGEGDYLFCDAVGNLLPYGSYSWAIGFFQSYPSFFNQEYFIVVKDKRHYGVVDRNGRVVLDFAFNRIHYPVNHEVFTEDTSGKRAFFNLKTRKWSTPYAKIKQFDLMQAVHHHRSLQRHYGFQEDYCLGYGFEITEEIENGDTSRYIDPQRNYFMFYDRKGKTRLKLDTSIRFVGVFTEGLAPAGSHKYGLGFIDKKGKWVVPPIYELAVAGAYPMPYLVIPEFKGGYAYIKSFKGYVDRKGRPYFDGERMMDRYDFSH
ncbi:MAG: WG repeat-containing protein [Bacteroidia bacterium]|nr:WG repeat-containing protein [Bacteroidia bacterium]